jgi:hypothetical protein
VSTAVKKPNWSSGETCGFRGGVDAGILATRKGLGDRRLISLEAGDMVARGCAPRLFYKTNVIIITFVFRCVLISLWRPTPCSQGLHLHNLLSQRHLPRLCLNRLKQHRVIAKAIAN